MQSKITKNSRKYIIVPIAALGLIAVLVFSTVDSVSANNSFVDRGDLASIISQKFGLDKGQVEETVQTYRGEQMQERHNRMQARLEERLSQAVSEGSLTDIQRYAILAKQEEIADKMQELRDQDLSPEDFRELKADLHDELETWADENSIDYDTVMRVGKQMMGRGYSMRGHMI